MPIPGALRSKDLDVRIEKEYLKVGIRGEGEAVIDVCICICGYWGDVGGGGKARQGEMGWGYGMGIWEMGNKR